MELPVPKNMLGGVRLLGVTLEWRAGNHLTQSCDHRMKTSLLSLHHQFCVAFPPAAETAYSSSKLGKEGQV